MRLFTPTSTCMWYQIFGFQSYVTDWSTPSILHLNKWFHQWIWGPPRVPYLNHEPTIQPMNLRPVSSSSSKPTIPPMNMMHEIWHTTLIYYSTTILHMNWQLRQYQATTMVPYLNYSSQQYLHVNLAQHMYIIIYYSTLHSNRENINICAKQYLSTE